MNVRDTLVVVSGASSGIGEATAKAFAARGARVALVARTRAALERVAAEIAAANGAAAPYDADLADGAAAQAVTRRIESDLGVPGVIVNCAGSGRWLFTEETEPSEALVMMQAPYLAAFHLTRSFLAAMIERGSGRIVNVNSPAAYAPWPGATGYAAARFALRGFSEALAVDLAGTGVGVTQVVAGECTSPYWEHNPGARERLPAIGRYFKTLTPQDVAAAIVRAVERDRSMVILPFSLRIVIMFAGLLPGLVRRMLVASGYKHQTARSGVS